jgi:hypothetical protein
MNKKAENALVVHSKFFDDTVKCDHCRWAVCLLFSFVNNDIDTEGLCGECFMEMIEENGWGIVRR